MDAENPKLSSPYPWSYALRWYYYFCFPSVRNRSKLDRMPIADSIVPTTSTDSATLVFCGDIMVRHGDVVPSLHDDLIEFVDGCDLFIGNCEAPVHERPMSSEAKYRFSFHMPAGYLAAITDQLPLERANIILNTANNHSGDAGYIAYLEGLKVLEDMGYAAIGAKRNSRCDRSIFHVRGLRLGFISWTQWMNCKIFKSQSTRPIDHEDVLEGFKELKAEENIDYLIATPHWEYEFQHFPHLETKQIAMNLVESIGIDLIVGSHPHTLQPMEKINSKHCFYSLGNFIGLGISWPVKLIPLLKVSIGVDGSNKGKLISYEIMPFVQFHEGNKINIIPLDSAPKNLREKMQKRLNKVFSPINRAIQ